MSEIYECQICHTQMIYTGKGEKDRTINENIGCNFYYCECGKKIVSRAFFNKDGTPQIFYDNVWGFNPKTGVWSTWSGHNWENALLTISQKWGSTKKDKPIPKKMRFRFR